jgi:hypothetical protein
MVRLQRTPIFFLSDPIQFAIDSAGMEDQIIEGRYLDRKMLLKMLGKLFPTKGLYSQSESAHWRLLKTVQ